MGDVYFMECTSTAAPAKNAQGVLLLISFRIPDLFVNVIGPWHRKITGCLPNGYPKVPLYGPISSSWSFG